MGIFKDELKENQKYLRDQESMSEVCRKYWTKKRREELIDEVRKEFPDVAVDYDRKSTRLAFFSIELVGWEPVDIFLNILDNYDGAARLLAGYFARHTKKKRPSRRAKVNKKKK